MKFKTFFKEEKVQIIDQTILTISEDTEDNLKKIRDKGIKIKSVIPTRFGNEIVFFKEYDAETAAKLLKTDKMDGKSIFIDK